MQMGIEQAGWVSGTTHGLLDGVLHIDTDKSVEQNFYDIMYSSARDGFTGTMWGVGWEIMGSLTQGMYLSPSVNIFLQGAGGGALSSTTNRYLSGGTITAETVIDDAYTSGLQALAFNKIGRAVQRMVTPRQKLPKGYLRDRANSVAELDASKQCETGKGAYVAPKGGGGITSTIKVNGKTITFGHGGRHLNGVGIDIDAVNHALAEEVSALNLEVGQFHKGQIIIEGITIKSHYTSNGV